MFKTGTHTKPEMMASMINNFSVQTALPQLQINSPSSLSLADQGTLCVLCAGRLLLARLW